MKKLLCCAVLLSGCAMQSGVMPEGRDSYLLIMSTGYGIASAGDLRISAHQEATAFCSKLGKRPETVTEKTIPRGGASDFYEEELKFRCVTAASAQPSPLTSAPAPASAVQAASAVPAVNANSH
jgi:hypothetical protein